MNKRKRKQKQSTKKQPLIFRNKKLLVLVVLLALLGIFLIGGKFNQFIQQQRDVKELQQAYDDLKPIYETLINENRMNVDSFSFKKDCGESSTVFGRGAIRCGVSGRIDLVDYMDSKLFESKIRKIPTVNFDYINTSRLKDETYLDLKLMSSELICHVSLGKNPLNNQQYIGLYCQKDVPDFLPGYEIRD